MKPTRLYVKQHKETGLLYFGKTTIDNPNNYNGSGVYWKNHLNKHGYNINTLWVSEEFTNEENITEFALFFSEEFDIVNSSKWANLITENGLDGMPQGIKLTEEHKMNLSKSHINSMSDYQRQQIAKFHENNIVSEETRKKMSKSRTGKTHSEETRKKLSELKQGKSFSDEHKLKLKEAAKSRIRKPHSEETKLRMSIAAKNRKLNKGN